MVSWDDPDVLDKLKSLKKTHRIVIFTNQKYVFNKAENFEEFNNRVEKIVKDICDGDDDSDIYVFAAFGNTKKRKLHYP